MHRGKHGTEHSELVRRRCRVQGGNRDGATRSLGGRVLSRMCRQLVRAFPGLPKTTQVRLLVEHVRATQPCVHGEGLACMQSEGLAAAGRQQRPHGHSEPLFQQGKMYACTAPRRARGGRQSWCAAAARGGLQACAAMGRSKPKTVHELQPMWGQECIASTRTGKPARKAGRQPDVIGTASQQRDPQPLVSSVKHCRWPALPTALHAWAKQPSAEAGSAGPAGWHR